MWFNYLEYVNCGSGVCARNQKERLNLANVLRSISVQINVNHVFWESFCRATPINRETTSREGWFCTSLLVW